MKKKLTPSDLSRHYIVIPSEYVDNFKKKEFNVKVNDEIIKAWIDNYNRLRLGSTVFNKLDYDRVDDIALLFINKEGEYVLKKV